MRGSVRTESATASEGRDVSEGCLRLSPVTVGRKARRDRSVSASGKTALVSRLTRIAPAGRVPEARRGAPAIRDERLDTRTRVRESRKTTAATAETVLLSTLRPEAGGRAENGVLRARDGRGRPGRPRLRGSGHPGAVRRRGPGARRGEPRPGVGSGGPLGAGEADAPLDADRARGRRKPCRADALPGGTG